MVNDPITMRTIIRILAQKFNAPSEYIAKKLSTPGSMQYLQLSYQLLVPLLEQEFGTVEKLIEKGADIDFQLADIYPILCGPKEFNLLLSMLNKAHLKQTAVAGSKQYLLDLEKMAMQSPEMAKRVEGGINAIQQGLESGQEELNNLISIIHDQVQRNKNIFKNDEQLNHVIAEINKGNFKKAFVILEPNTIISNDPTDYLYTVGETDLCMVGANLSLVMYTITANQPVLLEWLIKHNANLDLIMGTGDTALAMAINLGKKEIVELLVKNGANVNQQKILNVNEETFKKIEEFGAVAQLGAINQTPIFNTRTGKHYTVIDYGTLTSIMSNGLDLSEDTPLIQLLYSKYFTDEEVYDLIRLLLDNGANPDIQNAAGQTPLIGLTFMYGEGFANMMKLLLDYGANPLIKDNEGLTALDHMRDEETEDDPERNEKIEMLKNAIEKYRKK